MSEPTIHVIFGDQGAETIEVDIGESATGAQAIAALVKNDFIPAEPSGGGEWILKHKRTNATIGLAESFRSAGVRDGDFVKLLGANTGGALDASGLRSHKALDYEMLRGTKGDGVAKVAACASVADARQGRAAPEEMARAGYADAFLITLAGPMLKAPGEPLEEATVLVDVSSPEHPFAEPVVYFPWEMPFCIHVLPDNGAVCIGKAWEKSSGKMGVADLVVDLMRFCNFDEKLPKFDGLNYAAWTYWQEDLGGKALDPRYAYPVPPYEIVSGVGDGPALFSLRPRSVAAPAIVSPRLAAPPAAFAVRSKAAPPVFRVAAKGAP